MSAVSEESLIRGRLALFTAVPVKKKTKTFDPRVAGDIAPFDPEDTNGAHVLWSLHGRGSKRIANGVTKVTHYYGTLWIELNQPWEEAEADEEATIRGWGETLIGLFDWTQLGESPTKVQFTDAANLEDLGIEGLYRRIDLKCPYYREEVRIG